MPPSELANRLHAATALEGMLKSAHKRAVIPYKFVMTMAFILFLLVRYLHEKEELTFSVIGASGIAPVMRHVLRARGWEEVPAYGTRAASLVCAGSRAAGSLTAGGGAGRWVSAIPRLPRVEDSAVWCNLSRAGATAISPPCYILPQDASALDRDVAPAADASWWQHAVRRICGAGGSAPPRSWVLVSDTEGPVVSDAAVRSEVGSGVVQRTVDRALTLPGGQAFAVRFYVLIPGVRPFRAFTHGAKLVLTATCHGAMADPVRLVLPSAVRAHLANDTCLSASAIASLADVVPDAAGLDGAVERALAHAVAALWRGMGARTRDQGRAARGFQLLAVDMAVDTDLRPWVLSASLDASFPEGSPAVDRLARLVVGDALNVTGASLDRDRRRVSHEIHAEYQRAFAVAKDSVRAHAKGKAPAHGRGTDALRLRRCPFALRGVKLDADHPAMCMDAVDVAMLAQQHAEHANRQAFQPLDLLTALRTDAADGGAALVTREDRLREIFAKHVWHPSSEMGA